LARAAWLHAATWSAWSEKPHDWQTNSAWDLLFRFLQCPQRGRVLDVFLGSTQSACTPRKSGLVGERKVAIGIRSGERKVSIGVRSRR